MALPDKIGPYPVVRKLGEGGMGIVYEVRDPRLGRPLALKLIRTLGGSTTALARFWREAEALGKVQHPGVVAVHLTGQTSTGPYLVQELIDGEPLDRVVERGPLAPRRAAEVVRDLADALAAVHAQGLLHRDLKPGNVLLRADGRPVVIDFGLAWDAEAERLTRTGAPLGTPAYMAPEQAGGRSSAELDARCDVYGLGAILYELLAGAPPFQGETAFEVFGKVLHQDPAWPAEVRPWVPADLDAVVRRAMAKDRAARYPTAAALREDLERVLRGEEVAEATRAGSASSAAATLARSARRLAWFLAAAALALAGLGGGLWLHARAQADARARAEAAALADLEALGAALDAEPSPRLLEQVELALATARGLAACEGLPPERLAAAAAALGARRDRALLLRAAAALARAPASPGAAAIDTALDAAARVPPATPPDPEVEEARGVALLLAGQAADARAALARAAGAPGAGAAAGGPAAGGPAADADAAWLAAPDRRRAWLLAWAELAAGDAAAAEARLAPAPPLLRARLLAAAAALAADDAAAAGARERAGALVPREAAAAAALVTARLEVDALGRRPDAPRDARLDLLARVRAASLPASPGRVPRAVQAEACLLEGEVLQGLGWWASAAEAFARHARLAGADPPPSPLVPVVAGADGARCLAAPDLAARLGEARARALDLDAEAAAAARAAATARARRHPALAAADLEPAPDAAGAARLAAEGAAALAAARGAPAAPAAASRLAAARRAFTLALRGAPRDGEAWAGLAQVEALAGALGPARDALFQARERAPRAPATHEAALAAALAAGQPAPAREALDAALAALDAGGRRAPERAPRALDLLARTREALRAAGCAVDAALVLDLLGRRADAERAPDAVRRPLHEALAEEAGRLGRGDLAAAARERLAALDALKRRLAGARRRIDSLLRAKNVVDVRGQTQIGLLLAESPLEARVYLEHHNLGARFSQGGFDSLALAFELDPADTITYLDAFDPRDVAPEAAAAARASIAALAEPGEPDPTLAIPRDEALRLALGGLYALDARAPLAPATLRACHAAALDVARRRPGTLAAALLLGRLQVGVGDHAGALVTLERAEAIPPALGRAPSTGALAWSLFYRALAHGGLRQWDGARRCLERLAALPRARRTQVEGHRLREEPLLWEDRTLPGTLPGWAEDLARALDAP